MKIWTIRKIISVTDDFLKKKGCQTSRLDAEILLAHTLNMKRIDLYVNHDRPLSESELDLYREKIKRRGNREPVAYITGSKEFYSLDFAVGEGVLIPRPETEIIVDRVISFIKEKEDKSSEIFIAEPFTGSGAVSIAVANELQNVRIFAADNSKKALLYCEKNIRRHGKSGIITISETDILSEFLNPLQMFDVIAANPPYIPSAKIEHLEPEISRFEPAEALDGGEDGCSHIRKLIEQSSVLLKNNGLLIFEIGEDFQFGISRNILENSGCFQSIRHINDYSGNIRAVEAIKII
jgi:release factor glutamine methyltransferase